MARGDDEVSDGEAGRDDADEDEPGPNDWMRGGVPGSRLRAWLLMDANRPLAAAALLGVLFVVLVTLGVVDPRGIRGAMARKDPVETTFQALITAVITGVTLVVTVNQLVLSQELGAVGDQRERMEGAMDFRRDVEDVLATSVAPADPGAFLQAIVDVARERAEAVRESIPAGVEEDRRDRVEAYVDGLTGNARSVSDRLEGAEFGTFGLLAAALDFDYSRAIHEGRRLQSEFEYAAEEGTADGVVEALDDVVTALEFFGPAREHIKTLYFQWELIDLSRAVLYAAVPALVVSTGMILYVDDPASIPGSTAGVDNLIWVVSAAVTVALGPFALLFSYILRIATVTQRTLAIGPFVLLKSNRTEDGDRD